MSFTIKCDSCGNEEEFKEQESWCGENIELHPACWGGGIYLELECKNPICKESIAFEAM